MGTGAVYVTLSGLKDHESVYTTFETIFYFINIALFVLNTSTLILQAIREHLINHPFVVQVQFTDQLFPRSSDFTSNYSFDGMYVMVAGYCSFLLVAVYPKQALRLVKDPVKGIFVPLIVRLARSRFKFYSDSSIIPHCSGNAIFRIKHS
jgi:hypothetical protein